MRHWEHTHRTSVADGVLLCHQHHTLVHLRGHTLELETDGSVTVTRPDGSQLTGATPPPPSVEDPPADRPPDPPATTRRTGTGEPLTHDARDTIITVWHHHTPRRTSPPADPGDPHPT
jgi:hypothetical protein